ncbi:aminopeptidase [Halobacteriales archaeon SW_5_70_135]|nr:MAG: aminopeptidase [Halobacteriales archaeon SW_5_70_135]
MDDSVRRHAEVLVEHSIEASAGDQVLIRAPTAAEELVVALYERLGAVDARPETLWTDRRADRAYLERVDADAVITRETRLAATEAADAVVLVKAPRNAAEGSDVSGEVARARGEAKQPVLDARLDGRWVITVHPTAAAAQRAETSTAAYRDLVHDAVDRDWAAHAERQSGLAERLREAEKLRLVAGETTDLRLSVTGMDVYVDDATENLPGGEVATAPVPDSVEGTVRADAPLVRGGETIEGARLTFEDGRVVDHDAERNAAALGRLLDRDEGARRLGEVGVGTNRGLDRFVGDVLFDEKVGGTVHVALGRSMEECVPEGRPFNESAVHADAVVDTREDARLEVDGEVVLRDGRFRFED